MVEGDYNGILVADEHYIELKRDFSNIAQVMERIVKDEDRDRITKKAYEDIVASGKYTYERFVEFILACSFGKDSAMKSTCGDSFVVKACQWLSRICDRWSWVVVALMWYARGMARDWDFGICCGTGFEASANEGTLIICAALQVHCHFGRKQSTIWKGSSH